MKAGMFLYQWFNRLLKVFVDDFVLPLCGDAVSVSCATYPGSRLGVIHEFNNFDELAKNIESHHMRLLTKNVKPLDLVFP